MSGQHPDYTESTAFMILLGKLTKRCDDRPENLPELLAADPNVLELCGQVYAAAETLSKAEFAESAAFSSPTESTFLKTWREYERRYENILFKMLLQNVTGVPVSVPENFLNPDLRWQFANIVGFKYANSIERLVLACETLDDDIEGRILELPPDDEDDDDDVVISGFEAWNTLKNSVGFDPHGALRRRQLIPFVLVPRELSKEYGSEEAVARLKNLQEAQNAFVFGAPYAALALMRSIMESVLRDHYGVEGEDVEECIENARGILPPAANAEALHRLREVANAILHLKLRKSERLRKMNERLRKMNEKELEIQIMSLLVVLRELIEGGPQKSVQ